MSLALRIFLLCAAFLVLFFVVRKIKRAEFETMDAVFWLVFILVLAILAVFPQIAYAVSGVLGFDAPSNFVFLCVIAILIMRVFTLNVKQAHLRSSLTSLIQELALREAIAADEAKAGTAAAPDAPDAAEASPAANAAASGADGARTEERA